MNPVQLPDYLPEDVLRFWTKVNKHGSHASGEPYQGIGCCWEWSAGCFNSGYGCFKGRGVSRQAHRVAFFLENPTLNQDTLVIHRCDNRRCCRPSHLRCGDPRENHSDARARGRLPTGDRNGSRKHPESRPRGATHFSQMAPEKLARGEANGRAAFSEEQVRAIRAEYASSKPRQVDLAARYGVSQHAISCILLRKTWAHVL
jgi:hypothetical protein